MLEEKLVLIILNYKNYLLTERLVENLYSLNFKGHIIIVDNKSPNNSYKRLKQKYGENNNTHIIQNEINSGYANGNNYGIHYAMENITEIDYIGILNPDVILHQNFNFDVLLSEISDIDEISGITPMQILNNKFSIKNAGWKHYDFINLMLSNITSLRFLSKRYLYSELDPYEKNTNIAKIDVMPGSFFIMKKNDFKEIEFFDKNTFMYSEEVILTAKVREIKKNYAVSLKEYYIHDHQQKDDQRLNIKYHFTDYRWMIKSQRYYMNTYLKPNLIQKILFFLGTRFHLYIEIPIKIIIKNILR